jgi:hypothetical protein
MNKTTPHNLETKFNNEEDILDYFNTWQCPCNKCKEIREGRAFKNWQSAFESISERVAKLEERIKMLETNV